MFKKITDNFKYIKLNDIFAILIFVILLIPSQLLRVYYKLTKKRVWLICDRKDTANDNGYHFFKYMKKNHKEILSYYVIDKKCSQYSKVKDYNSIIQWGSITHWLLYLSCEKNISSQKNGNPSAPLFYILHTKLNLFNNRVFLQHGVIKDDLKWLYYSETKFKFFICSAKDEYEYVMKKYGYPKGNVVYTGLARFDNLQNNKVNKKQILIMPTWRNWLGRELNSLEHKINFKNTSYFTNWNSLINNDEFNTYLKENDITAVFYPHYGMHKYINCFNINNKSNIRIANVKTEDIQKLLKESALLITDYSSVYMDFAYMKKPIIYFQFDQEEYRSKQYEEGYFNYNRNGFGDVITDEKSTIIKIEEYIENDYKIEKKYMNRMNNFFELNDSNNSERIFKILEENKK